MPNTLISDFDFLISNLSVSFVSDFELRISDFDSVRHSAMKRVGASGSSGTKGQKTSGDIHHERAGC
jgi:hypothetical protein